MSSIACQSSNLQSLRARIHALHGPSREEALEMLAELPEPDASRERIRLYHECYWRDTKKELLRQLGDGSRAVEFLIHVGEGQADLDLARHAIDALGRSRSPIATAYLAHRWNQNPDDPLKPFVVRALGRTLGRDQASALLEVLSASLSEGVLRENELEAYALTFSRWRYREAIPVLWQCLGFERARMSVLIALLDLGESRERVLREGARNGRSDVDLLERYPVSTPTLEDRLERLGGNGAESCDSDLMEINNEDPEDVLEGIRLVSESEGTLALFSLLAHWESPLADEFYQAALGTELDEEELLECLRSLSVCRREALEGPVLELEGRATAEGGELLQTWLDCVALGFADGPRRVASLYESWDLPERRVAILNALVKYGLSIRPMRAQFGKLVDVYAGLLRDEDSPHVVGRWLRGFAQWRTPHKKAARLAIKAVMNPAIRSSCLVYFECCPSKPAKECLERLDSAREVAPLWLRATLAQERPWSIPLDFLGEVLEGQWGEDALIEGLCIVRHEPKIPFLDSVLRKAQVEGRCQVPAIIALGSYREDMAVEVLVDGLSSPAESIRGRSLDSLCRMDSDQARFAVLHHLDQHLSDSAVVDKVVRSWTRPRSQRQNFQNQLQGTMEKVTEEEARGALSMLIERVRPSGGIAMVTDARIDEELVERIDGFMELDESIRASLRTAELPYIYPDAFAGEIDKSTSILEYCKAVDLYLERRLGRALLFPRLQEGLEPFLNVIYIGGLHSDYPPAASVAKALKLPSFVAPDKLPIAKMVRVARSILDGRILHQEWRVLDGLRSWSAALFCFVRGGESKIQWECPVILPKGKDRDVFWVAQELNALQEIRNPVAHRRTMVELKDVEAIRERTFVLFEHLNDLFA